MGLHQNGYRDNVGVFRYAGLTVSNGCIPSALPINTALTGSMRNLTAGEGITSEKVGVPFGAKHPIAWRMPQKTGGISSHRLARGEATATLSMAKGWNLTGADTGTSFAEATLQLIVSTSGTSTGTSTGTGGIIAALYLEGESVGTSTATAPKDALGWLYGQADGDSTASLTSYATGTLIGAITPFTELSPQSLAQTVLDYAETSPIHSDIRKVNSYTVTGEGTSGNPWGP